MHIVFVGFLEENFGIESLSAVLRAAGHTTALVLDDLLFREATLNLPRLGSLLSGQRRLPHRVLAQRPDLIAFSTMSFDFPHAVRLARRLRALTDTPLLVGGTHPTAVGAHVLQGTPFDYAVRGEGEAAIVELCARLERREPVAGLPNLVHREAGDVVVEPLGPAITDLDTLPHLDKSLYAPEFPWNIEYRTFTSRGCVNSCAFCESAVRNDLGAGYRFIRRSPGHVLEEMDHWLPNRRYRLVHFWDAIFTMNQHWLEQFLPEVRARFGLPWYAEGHVQHLTPPMARLLKDTGCAGLQFGVEWIDNHVAGALLDRHVPFSTIQSSLALCDDMEIPYGVDHMFGLPGEDVETNRAALHFYGSCKKIFDVTCFDLYLFPGLPLVDRLYQRGDINARERTAIQQGDLVWRSPARRHQRSLRAIGLAMSAVPLLPRRARTPQSLDRLWMRLRRCPDLTAAIRVIAAAVHGNQTFATFFLNRLSRLLRRLHPWPPPPRAG